MPRSPEAQIVELFHLAFLLVLQRRLDSSRYALKGGVNLRFFFGSIRYSEDMDIDLVGDKPWSFTETIDKVLESQALSMSLAVGGLTVEDVSKPKQIATVSRWKVGVAVKGSARRVRTKIEFSSRGEDPRRVLEAVPGEVTEPYGVRPPKVQHYCIEAAAEQKVAALAGRSATQARDVFDLDLLLRRDPQAALGAEETLRREASERAVELPYAAFQDQVEPYLDPLVSELYNRDAWDQMQVYVADRLESRR